ncbi:MAG: hypothetical protein P8J50_02620 [Acidimicrobiales bacterium]|jgi:hypothetical protein|nr:hypothetical protein [Acidimicrobiales bacterium]
MSRLTYSQDELLADHDYAEDHVVLGERLHGGMLADGSYQPPRALVREPAFDAWEAALRDRGGEPFGATAQLLDGLRMPTPEQQLVLLRNDLGQSFWNSLTITGKIEAKGRLLAEMAFPDLQPVIVDDISEMAIGHLNKGLLLAHGLDEGGLPDEGIGGHDAMWFAARDLVFGPGAFPDVEPPENIGRADAGSRYVPEVAPEIEGTVSFLANLLIIEFRAEIGFADTQQILRTADVFTDLRDNAELAAEIVERIRIDEAIHVRSLNLYLGEMRSLSFRTLDGGTVSGAELIDRFWSGLVNWATVEQPKLAADETRQMLHGRIAVHDEADRVLAEFEAAA